MRATRYLKLKTQRRRVKPKKKNHSAVFDHWALSLKRGLRAAAMFTMEFEEMQGFAGACRGTLGYVGVCWGIKRYVGVCRLNGQGQRHDEGKHPTVSRLPISKAVWREKERSEEREERERARERERE